MTRMLRRFLRDDRAATAIEYGLIAALVSLAIFLGVGSFAGSLTSLWDGNSGKVAEAFNR